MVLQFMLLITIYYYSKKLARHWSIFLIDLCLYYPYGKNSQKYTEKNTQNNTQIILS